MFFCQKADQTFKQFGDADQKQQQKGENGEDAVRQERTDKRAEPPGSGDEKRGNKGKGDQGRCLDMDAISAIGEAGGQRIQRDGSQKKDKGGECKGHRRSPQHVLLYSMGAEKVVERCCIMWKTTRNVKEMPEMIYGHQKKWYDK